MIKQALIYHLVPRHRREAGSRRGQSLVEFALVLPVLLLIVAGTLEVANILTMQNHVQQAAREGARFGAVGGVEQGIRTVVVDQSSKSSLATDEDRMTVWIIRPIIDIGGGNWYWEGDAGGTTWGDATEQRVYGTEVTNPLKPADVLKDLKDSPAVGGGTPGDIDGTRFVIVVVHYKANTVLNMPFFKIPDEEGGLVPLWAYSIMRQEVEQETVAQLVSGCSAYPIAINSAWFPAETAEGEVIENVPLNNEFTATKREGFQFLAWNVSHVLTAHLQASLTFPGNSLDPTLGFEEYLEPGDVQMHRGDWVIRPDTNVTVANAAVQLGNHRSTGRTLRIIGYTFEQQGSAPIIPINPMINTSPPTSRWQYRIDGFVVVRIADFSTGADTIDFEFVRWDSSCGFE